MIAFGYIRVSGKGQIDGDGPERQEQSIRAFCAQHGLELFPCFFEPAVSGTVEAMSRPAFVDIVTQIDTRREDGREESFCIVVERMDRLARDLTVSEMLLRECRNRNIKVYAADQGILTDMASEDGDPSRVLIRQILGAVAQWEKSVIVKKLRASRDRKRAATGRCEGPLPFGQLPGEAPALKYLKFCRDNGLSFSKVAFHANANGHLTRQGKPWSRATVYGVLVR